MQCDRCPFSPHQAWSRCPVFERETFRAKDSTNRPLSTHEACAHLRVGQAGSGRYYPRCAVGGLEVPAIAAAAAPERIELATVSGGVDP